jgi:hypothetical protein
VSAAASALAGLPDFSAPIALPGQTQSIYAPYLGGSYLAMPQSVQIGVNADGSPDISLVMVKSATDLSRSGQYAVFDFVLSGNFELSGALLAVRDVDPNSTVAAIPIDGGFTRLFATNSAVIIPPDLLEPVSIGGLGCGLARWTARISPTAGALVKGALEDSANLLGAQIEYQYAGVAARVASIVTFTPSAVVNVLLAAYPGRIIARDELQTAMQQCFRQGLIQVDDLTNPALFAVLADWFATSYCRFVPAASIGDAHCLLLNDSANVPAAAINWDLSQPTRVMRQAIMTLDQLGSFTTGAVAAMVREVLIPSMPVGHWTIQVTANLPQHRSPMSVLGVSVQLPARPPFRPSSIDHQLPLAEPQDEASCTLQLSPQEALTFSVQPYAVIAGKGGVHTYTGTARPQTDTWVRLTAADFPVVFGHFTGSQQLLAVANLLVTFTCTLPSGAQQQQFSLNAATSEIAYPFPAAGVASSMQITAMPLDGSAPLTLGPFAPGRLDVDLSLFREYGPHRIAASVDVAPETPLSIELIAEERRDDPKASTGTLFFAAGQLSGNWGYFTNSPFHSGYCYRVATASASTTSPAPTPQPWSPVLSAFQPLMLHSDGSQISSQPLSPIDELSTPIPNQTQPAEAD